ncbi:Acid phosphatase [Diplonema papillatum]|nr:Acid phosphatase [Diplonema papillatum]
MLAPILLSAMGALAANTTVEQVHIMFQGQNARGNPSGMNVGWYTLDNTATSKVVYGLSETALNMTATGSSKKYYHEGWHHNADLPNLMPATRYHYKVVGEKEGDDSAVFSFMTAPDSSLTDFSISWFGDMGYLGSAERPELIPGGGLKLNWSAVPSRVSLEKLKNEGKIDFVWHVGDIGYADDSFDTDLIGGRYERCYNGFVNWMQNLSATMPYAVSPGNHESECHDPECIGDPIFLGLPLSNFSAYNTRWHMPSASSGGVESMWYSFNYGSVHFVSINSETDFPGAGEEHRGDSGAFPAGGFAPNGTYLHWLEADLAAAHAARVSKAPGARKWIIAGGHRPCCVEIPQVQALFDKYEVDMYVAGHEHTYARSTKGCAAPACTNSGHSASNATTYVFCGGSGSDETSFVTSGPAPQPGSNTFATPELSTCVLHFNMTSVNLQLISSIDHRVIDNVVVGNNY